MNGIANSQMPVEQGEMFMSALAAHIAEHYALDLKVKVAAQLGIPVEQFQQLAGQPLPPQLEAQMAQAIAEIEAERAPPEEGGESRVEVEQVKGQMQIQKSELEHRQTAEMEAIKARHASELQAQKDEAEMARAKQDDETALEIANMKAEGDVFDASSRAGIVSR